MQPPTTPHPCAVLARRGTRVHRLASAALERYRRAVFGFRQLYVAAGVRIEV